MDLRTSFRYFAPLARLHAGAISQIYAEAQRIGAKRAFIIACNTLSRTTNLVNKVRETLRDLYVGTFDGAKKESPIPTVMAGVDAAEAAITYVAAYQNSLGLSTRLRDLGVKKEDFRKLAELDVAEPGFGQGMNRVTDINELISILEMSW